MTSGTRIYIGRLSYDVRERDIEKFFKNYGRIREILLKDGFAFVEFDDQRDAEDAVYELNGKDLMGERVHVEFARGPSRGRGGGAGGRFGDRGRSDRYSSSGGSSSRRNGYSDSRYGPPRNTEYRVIVENLSSRVSWQDLKDFMRQAGDVTYADAHKREKNMGIVDFATQSDMRAALDKLDGQDLHGRRIRLHEDKSRRRRTRSRSRSPRGAGRSKSRSRSRSRSPSKSRSRSVSKSRSGSPVRRPKDDRSKSPASRSSRSRSVSPANGKADVGGDRGNRSVSRDRKSPSRSRSRSPMRTDDSRSRSRSRSASPDKDRDNED